MAAAPSTSPPPIRLPVFISTLVQRLDAFEALPAKAIGLYRDIVQAHAAGLDKALGELTVSVEKLLNAKQAA